MTGYTHTNGTPLGLTSTFDWCNVCQLRLLQWDFQLMARDVGVNLVERKQAARVHLKYAEQFGDIMSIAGLTGVV